MESYQGDKEVLRKERRTILLLLGLALLLRVSVGAASHSIVHADEVFQYLEQAHRVTFGYGAVPWEFRVGARSWLLPGSVAIIMRATSYFFGDAPEIYLAMIRAAFSVLSLSVVLVGFLWAYRIEGRSAAILTGVLCAVWYEFVFFAFHPMPGVVAAHFLLPGVYLMYPGAPTESRWRLFAGAALVGLAFVLRIQVAVFLVIVVFLACRYSLRRWVVVAAGISVPLFLSGVLDIFTWGIPFHSNLEYFRANALLHTVSLREGTPNPFGAKRWDLYLRTLVNAWSFFLLPILFSLWQVRREYILWAPAVVYVGALCFLSHKEYRFLYPALVFLIVGAGIGLARLLKTKLSLGALWPRRVLAPALLVCALGSAFGAAYYGIPLREKLRLLRDLDLADAARPFHRTHWRQWSLQNESLLWVGSKPDACGVAVLGLGWWQTGGYAYLHRNIPLLVLREPEKLLGSTRQFNYLIALTGVSLKGYRTVAELPEWGAPERRATILYRDGPCEGSSPWDIQAQMDIFEGTILEIIGSKTLRD